MRDFLEVFQIIVFFIIFIGLIGALIFGIFYLQDATDAPCPEYHKVVSTPYGSKFNYCDHCGICLRPSCSCGHVWTDDQQYCPECGLKR